ncbi:MAG: hypothetical protein V8Q84_11605 [Bilophila sp.]
MQQAQIEKTAKVKFPQRLIRQLLKPGTGEMRDYPTLHEVLAIHAEAIKVYGGSNGVCDLGAIEAALFRPQSGYSGQDIIAKAAALMERKAATHQSSVC